jgi:hypothetical protein
VRTRADVPTAPARGSARAATLAAVVLVLVLAGCGADYPDLMVIRRTGALPDANVTLLINDGGTVRCDRGEVLQMPPRPLLDAREIARELAEEASDELVLPRPPGAQLRFRMETQDGTVTFSDADAASRPLLGRLVLLTRTIAQDVCGLAR